MNSFRKVVYCSLLLVFLSCLFVEFTAAKVFHLNFRNYRTMIHNPRMSVLVFFHKTPCVGSCGEMQAVVDQTAAKWFNATRSHFQIGEVDCSVYQDIARRFLVEAYPTLLLFTPTNKTGMLKYDGGASVDKLEEFLRLHGINLSAQEDTVSDDHDL